MSDLFIIFFLTSEAEIMSDKRVMTQPRPFIETTVSNQWTSGICDCFHDLPQCECVYLHVHSLTRLAYISAVCKVLPLMHDAETCWATGQEYQQMADCRSAATVSYLGFAEQYYRKVITCMIRICDHLDWRSPAVNPFLFFFFFFSGCFAFWCFPCFACKTAREAGECLCLPLLDSFGIIPPITTALRVSIRQRYGIEVWTLCPTIKTSE